ncbi:MAG TPA: hypothetical protein VGM01_07845 [Ktedonobacteraceae bacterium]|jgi:hypothetical protein
MIYEMLAHMKKRPEMYMSRPSITALSYYVHGFELAVSLHNILSTEDEREFQRFKQWVAREYSGANLGWWGQLLLFISCQEQLESENDSSLEEKAFTHFFALLEQYSTLFRQAEAKVNMLL